jgi:hypothetical protein
VPRFIAGAVAVAVGGALAFATAFGVVNVVNSEPKDTELDVMDYGTTEQ